MFAKLFLLFAIMPIVEIALLVNVSGVIGGWNTIILVILTAFIGAHLVRQQGLATFATVQRKLQSGEVPSQEVAEGILLLIAGVLLVTPGFVTDVIGFLFCLPVTRPIIARQLAASIMRNTQVRTSFQTEQPGADFVYTQSQSTRHHTSQPKDSGVIIEGEYDKKPENQRTIE